MALVLSDSALDWSLTHALAYGDTDIFPEAFEFAAIAEDWGRIKTIIRNEDVSAWSVRAYRRCLVPKHRFGFRISTQLDPLDFLVFTTLIREVGKKLESMRIPLDQDIVHSFRFQPASDGRMFSDKHSYASFQRASHKACESYKPSHVVIADIADFFPRLNFHRMENALDTALGVGHMHAKALKDLIAHWAGTYSYGLPVGSAAARLIAEATISDIDQLLLSEGTKYVRYSDDFRIFCQSEADAYKYLTLLARALFENHGLTLQQNKTKIVTVDNFRKYYLRENVERELDTLSDQFQALLNRIGIVDTYGDINFDELSYEHQRAIGELNLAEILKEQIQEEEPDLSLLKFLLRRLGQISSSEAIDLIVDNFEKFVPVVRETIEYLLRIVSLVEDEKAVLGQELIKIYSDKAASASYLEYSRMYILRPFAVDSAWKSDEQYVKLYNDSNDEFSRRELLLAMGKSKKDFWFRSKKQSLHEMTPWVRRAFIRSASCMPADEFKHWIRGIDGQLDPVERAVAAWAQKKPMI